MIKHNGYLLVTVQEEASGFNIVNSLNPPHLEWEYPVDGDDPGTYDCADLPPGNWQLIGLAADVIDDHSEMDDVIRSHNMKPSTTVILKEV